MTAELWFTNSDDILRKIRETQLDSIRQAAQLIADSAAAGGGLHFYDSGHCPHEPIHRAGGLCMMKLLEFSFSVHSQPAPKRAPEVSQRLKDYRKLSDEKLVSLAVERSGLAPGDVLIVSSVSGKSPTAVEAALAGKRLGARLIAITNVTYSKAVESQHSSGKRLFEVAELVIDNCGVIGDAVLNVEGVDTGVAPTSGLAFCYIIWAIVTEAIGQMLARGLQPHVYRSVNLPDGEAYNERAETAYRETGI